MAEGKRASDNNKKVLRRFYNEVVNAGNIDLIDELLADDFVEHEEVPGLPADREGVKQFFGMMRAAFPDVTFTAEQMLAEGDTVAARATIRGTHQGEFMGVPATGRPVEFQATDFVSFRNGTATAHWGTTDMVALLTQLGAIEPPG
jgi:steroid delta-isomerase-like uncharacterized protein